jgi:lipoprotein-anchoring transpeptidase ErfK/SrfK
MNEIPNLKAEQLLQASKKALQEGRRSDARNLALQAVELDPNIEETWLILAALASPQASLAYLQNALRINPNSDRARLGMKWAMDRVQKEGGIPTTPGVDAVKSGVTTSWRSESSVPVPPGIPDTKPPTPLQMPKLEPMDALRRDIQSSIEGKKLTQEDQSLNPQVPGKKKSSRFSLWVAVPLIAILLACLGLVGFSLLSTHVADASSAAAAQVPTSVLFKPSLTPTPTITPTPTNTPTPTSTPTVTPIPTETSTPAPYPTVPPQTSYENPPSGVDADERWIDVDLSQQMVYAYVGSELVNSFLVSTGTSAHPTVTGRYHIYVKYLYDDMSGPGYFLPDVPYVMYFYSGYSLHGTYWHHNFGTPMSHGCVNMYTPDAEWLFNWASVGTLVNVHY